MEPLHNKESLLSAIQIFLRKLKEQVRVEENAKKRQGLQRGVDTLQHCIDRFKEYNAVITTSYTAIDSVDGDRTALLARLNGLQATYLDFLKRVYDNLHALANADLMNELYEAAQRESDKWPKRIAGATAAVGAVALVVLCVIGLPVVGVCIAAVAAVGVLAMWLSRKKSKGPRPIDSVLEREAVNQLLGGEEATESSVSAALQQLSDSMDLMKEAVTQRMGLPTAALPAGDSELGEEASAPQQSCAKCDLPMLANEPFGVANGPGCTAHPMHATCAAEYFLWADCCPRCHTNIIGSPKYSIQQPPPQVVNPKPPTGQQLQRRTVAGANSAPGTSPRARSSARPTGRVRQQ